MRKYIKYLILLTLILVGLSSLGIISCAENHKPYNLNLTIDGELVNFTPDLGYPYLTKTQRTMVPIRIISENMGYDVDWSKDTWGKGERKVWISNNTTRIELEIGKSTAIVNGKVVPIDRSEKTGKPVDTKAELVGSRTYVPIRFITEAMGGKVGYDRKDGNHYITITTGKDTEPVEPTEPTTPSEIKGNVDEMTTWEGFEAVKEYFGKYQNGNGMPIFQAIAGSSDGAFFWISDEFVEDPYEVMIVIHSWYVPSARKEYESMGSLELYQLINPAVKEVLRFYLPNGGADELYKIIDDGYNGRLGDRPVIGVDISNEIGADRPVKIIQGGGTRIHIGAK